MKSNKKTSSLILAAALLAMAVTSPARLSAQTERWSVQVTRVDPRATSLPPAFQVAIYEDLVEQLTKGKQFDRVLRDGDRNSVNTANLLVLKATCQKYTAGSETRRAVTTISGATKLILAIQLVTPDGKIVFDRPVKGNVRFLGSNLRATHNVARNIVKRIKKSSLPQPPQVLSKTTKPRLSDDIVVVQFE